MVNFFIFLKEESVKQHNSQHNLYRKYRLQQKDTTQILAYLLDFAYSIIV